MVYNRPIEVESSDENFVTIKQDIKLSMTPQKQNKIIISGQRNYDMKLIQAISLDNKISTAEGISLRKWMYENNYLAGYYPFDQIMSVLDCVLEDNIITKEEFGSMICVIKSLLEPVQELREQINSVKGKQVCLSGTFSHGQKSDVEKIIIQNGGFIDSSIKKTTDILIIGDSECQAYAFGNYGTKVQKAIEYSNKGHDIKIIKESDYFSNDQMKHLAPPSHV